MSNLDDLANKYRPRTFQEVLGQESTIQSLQKIIETDGKLPNCTLLVGDPGTGKTSIARILAKQVGCLDENIIELNTADTNSVEDMRSLIQMISYRPINGDIRVIILDECQKVTSSAWDSLLKPIEEPPTGTYWILLSTDPSKIRPAILTRCHQYNLGKVPNSLILKKITEVIQKENLSLDKQMTTLITVKSNGSPRKALVYLSQARGCKSIEELKQIIQSTPDDEDGGVIALARALSNPQLKWQEAMNLFRNLNSEEPESVRAVLLAYHSKIAANSDSQKTIHHLKIIDAFLNTPFMPQAKLAPVLLALGKIIL